MSAQREPARAKWPSEVRDGEHPNAGFHYSNCGMRAAVARTGDPSGNCACLARGAAEAERLRRAIGNAIDDLEDARRESGWDESGRVATADATLRAALDPESKPGGAGRHPHSEAIDAGVAVALERRGRHG